MKLVLEQKLLVAAGLENAAENLSAGLAADEIVVVIEQFGLRNLLRSLVETFVYFVDLHL